MKASFRNAIFTVLEGTVHPAYSLECFTADECGFRDRHWWPLPGQVVVDVGASYGAYTLTAISQGATVWAFEPEQSVLVDLIRNVEANGWLEFCQFFSFGLWDCDEIVPMGTYAPHWPPQTISGDFHMRRLDDLFIGDALHWMKIDAEGAEERIIRGALATIAKHKPRLIIECHVFLDAELANKVKALLPEYRWTEEPRDPCVLLIGECQP